LIFILTDEKLPRRLAGPPNLVEVVRSHDEIIGLESWNVK